MMSIMSKPKLFICRIEKLEFPQQKEVQWDVRPSRLDTMKKSELLDHSLNTYYQHKLFQQMSLGVYGNKVVYFILYI